MNTNAKNQVESTDLNRREFLKQTGRAVSGLAVGAIAGGSAAAQSMGLAPAQPVAAKPEKAVRILIDPSDRIASAPPARWAIQQLEASLLARGLSVRSQSSSESLPTGEIALMIAGANAPAAREVLDAAKMTIPGTLEALGLVPGKLQRRPLLLACANDVRGLVFATLELADRVTHTENASAALSLRRPLLERPANVIRSVARSFVSEIEDKSWYYDRAFWDHYLSTLIAQRFNRFSLTFGIGYDFTSHIRDAYFHFAYPFLLAVPGHAVRAVNLSDAERDRNLETLRFISELAVARGLQFQLGLWTHAYKWTESPQANYTIEGLTPETHAVYCRDALRTLLQSCPAISGVTIRIHGESGVPEGSYDFWKTVFDGAAQCGRPVEIDMHAKGIDRPMIDLAVATGLPVNVSPKFWAEHQGLPYHQSSIRALEMPPRESQDQGFFAKSSGSRRFLRYGYGDLFAEGRRHGVLHRIWPGTQRLLLWGDPVFAAAYGRAFSFCGSAGVELCEPLFFKGRKGSGLAGGREAYVSHSDQPPGGAWEKYLYSYRIWGRLLYNPDADPETWRRYLRSQFGHGGEAAETALGQASRILPLLTTAHLPSAANNNFWPEIYTNMPIVDAAKRHPYGDSPSPKRFGTVSPLDPELFSRVDDFADELISGKRTGKYSPIEVAQWLETLADNAAHDLAQAERRARNRESIEFERWDADVAIQIGLGQFFAAKLRAGVLYALYERNQDLRALQEALKAYRAARTAWTGLAQRAAGVYVNDITFGWDKHLRGHWKDRLPAIEDDIADMAKRLEQAAGQPLEFPGLEGERRDRALQEALKPSGRPRARLRHTAPPVFTPGQPIGLEVTLSGIPQRARPVTVRLHYRHVNQGEQYEIEEKRSAANQVRLVIPGEYTRSPFPVQFFFELHDALSRAWLHPGFDDDLANQPYFVLQPRPVG